jgi:hypothetical protein
MRSYLLYSLIALSPLFSFSQSGSIKGKVSDSSLKQNLSSATASVIKKSDSSFAGFSIADKKGFFEIYGLNYGEYILTVSYNGYENLQKLVSVSKEHKSADAGDIFLQKRYKTLDGVTVTDAAPIRMHGDTISFKASAFNTDPNATVEDVLKKMPGMQVQKDGSISSMGETVQKVYVNGKEFFGNDPKMATRNITADMVDQIQVFDDMSEQSKFTKIDDGSRARTINIKLKKDKARGDFGRFNVGAGTDDRYEGSLSYNRFKGNTQLSAVGSANNTNKQSYSFGDASSQSTTFSQGGSSGLSAGGMNAVAGSGAGGSGISIPKSAGLNYNDMWGRKIDFRGSYQYSENEFFLQQNSLKNYSFPGDSSSVLNTISNTKTHTKNNRVNARWEINIDSANSILYTAALSLQKLANKYTDTLSTFSNAMNDYIALTGKTGRLDSKDGTAYSGELLYRRRFRIPGRTFTLGWRNGHFGNDAERRSYNPITVFNPDATVRNFLNVDQQDFQESDNTTNMLSASYTEPLGKNKLLEFNYAYADNKNISDKKTFDFNTISGKYDIVNLYQTNFFEYNNRSNRAGTNFRVQKSKYNYQLGVGVQHSELESRSLQAINNKDTTITQRYVNIFPTANFNYTISRSKSLRFYYRGRTNAPNINQLQDVADYSNPLQVKTGNPNLRQEFHSNLNLGYSAFNPRNFRFFSANINFNTVANKIVNTIDSSGNVSLVMKPENINGSYNTSGMFSFGFPFKKMRGTNLNISTMAYYSRDITKVYGENNYSNILMINQLVSFTYSKPKFDLSLSGSFVYNKVNYTFLNAVNTEYFKQAWSADFNYRIGAGFFILSDFDYVVNSGRAEGYNVNISLWNMAIAKQFTKTKAAEIKLTAYDILNQNKGVNRTVGDNYFEDVRTNVVRRFILLSFTYTLKQKALRKPQPQSKPAGPMMMFQ